MFTLPYTLVVCVLCLCGPSEPLPEPAEAEPAAAATCEQVLGENPALLDYVSRVS